MASPLLPGQRHQPAAEKLAGKWALAFPAVGAAVVDQHLLDQVRAGYGDPRRGAEPVDEGAAVLGRPAVVVGDHPAEDAVVEVHGFGLCAGDEIADVAGVAEDETARRASEALAAEVGVELPWEEDA